MLFDSLPKTVSIYEVSPRDGLQNEAVTVPTAQKLRLIHGLVEAGLRRVELSSYVSPRWVPQLADADDVTSLAPRQDGVTYSALCPNARGLERALAARVQEVCVFVSASDTHNRKNVNRSVKETLERFESVIGPAIESGLRVRGYVSTAWGCPFEGDVEPRKVLDLCVLLIGQGCYQVSLGDTIGVGDPVQTRGLLSTLYEGGIKPDQLALHCHDTRGTALCNILVGLDMGVTTFDGSVAGLGGCPFAPGAAGNVATEDLVYLLERMGVSTGIDLQKLWDAGQVARSVVGRDLPGKVHRAGLRSLRI